jgi:phosphatidate cytidylyltransferase
MIGGKTLEGPKLAPKISPNKTWSGLICGCLASATVCFLSGELLNISLPINLFIYGLGNAVVAQISDLFISFFKRKCSIKDTGTLIPGHGGVLDRFDGTMFSAALLLLLIKL